MSEHNLPDAELLSALFDNELDEAQRARCAALLESSPDARNQLRDWEHLSQVLRSLPSESAPESLGPAVMATIERDMLLGPAPTPSVAQPPPRRLFWSWGTGLAAACVMLIALLQVLQRSEPRNETLSRTTQTDESAPKAADMAISAGKTRTSEQTETETASNLAENLSETRSRMLREDPSAAAAGQAAMQDTSPPAVAADSVHEALEVPVPAKAADSLQDAPAEPRAFGTAASRNLELPEGADETPVGGLIQAIERRGGKIKVVELTVVDRRQGLDALQLLLSRPDADAESTQTMERGTGSASEDDVAADALLAVLVELPDQRLAGALQQLQNSHDFQNVTVRDDVAVREVVASMLEVDAQQSDNPSPSAQSAESAQSDRANAAGGRQSPPSAKKEHDVRSLTQSPASAMRRKTVDGDILDSSSVVLGKPFRLGRGFLQKVAVSTDKAAQSAVPDAEETSKMPADGPVLFVVVGPTRDSRPPAETPPPADAAPPAAPRGESA